MQKRSYIIYRKITQSRMIVAKHNAVDEQFEMPDYGSRPVAYADKQRLQAAILAKYPRTEPEPEPAPQVRTPKHISALKGGD